MLKYIYIIFPIFLQPLEKYSIFKKNTVYFNSYILFLHNNNNNDNCFAAV